LATEICSIINQIFEDHRGIAYLALCHGWRYQMLFLRLQSEVLNPD
jgi:hypothetical protein